MTQTSEIYFGGLGALGFGAMRVDPPPGTETATLPQTNEEFHQRYADALASRPLWFQVFEKAFAQLTSTEEGRTRYGNPERGATLEQAWRAQFAISGIFQVCLLASGRPEVPTRDIPETVLMMPAQLVQSLARGFTLADAFAAQLFVHDGRMGHAITLLGHDPLTATFTYLDPWPDRSLLCREHNAAGVAAQPTEKGLWRITEAELTAVIFAAFIMPTFWADLTGQAYRISYVSLQQTDFWKAFGVREAGRKPDETRTTVFLQPGNFREDIQALIKLDRTEDVRSAKLALRRRWIVGKPWGVNPDGSTLARRFIATLIPEPDRGEAAPFVDALRDLRSQDTVRSLLERHGKTTLSPAENLQATYLGLPGESTALLTFSRLKAQNIDHGGEPWLMIEVELY
jgi:hypothetical protein